MAIFHRLMETTQDLWRPESLLCLFRFDHSFPQLKKNRAEIGKVFHLGGMHSIADGHQLMGVFHFRSNDRPSSLACFFSSGALVHSVSLIFVQGLALTSSGVQGTRHGKAAVHLLYFLPLPARNRAYFFFRIWSSSDCNLQLIIRATASLPRTYYEGNSDSGQNMAVGVHLTRSPPLAKIRPVALVND